MANENVNIVIKAVDKTKSALTGVQKGLGAVKSAVFSLQGALLGLGAGAAIKSIITVASEVESLQIRLKFLTGSTEDAAKAFDTMNKFAAKVPFSLEDIERASPSLLTVADNVDELNNLLAITGDIAAVSGLAFDETAMQLQRAMSAGIASADLFRDRGVSAFLGFQSGVSVSAEETKKRINEMWRDGTTTAVGATNQLSKSFMGQVSMMKDAWRELKLVIADAGAFEEASKVIINMTKALKDPAFKEGVKAFSESLITLFKFIVDNKTALIAVGSIYLGAKIGKVFGTIGVAIGAATGALIAFNKEIKEFFGFAETNQIEVLNKKIANTLDLITSLQGNSVGMVGDKSNQAIVEATKKLAEYRLQIALINEELLEGKPPVATKDIPEPAGPKYQNNQDFPLINLTDHMSHYDMLMSVQDAHYKVYGDAKTTHEKKMLEQTHQWLSKQSAMKKAAAANDIDTLQESGTKVVGALKGQYKWAFNMHKQFAIKDALIDTYKAVSTALASAPPPLNFGLAAVALAQGVATVQSLRSTQFREKGGPISAGSPYIVGERGPELIVPNQAASVVPNDQLGGNNVTINVTTNDARGFDDLLTRSRGTLVGLINQALNENGRQALV